MELRLIRNATLRLVFGGVDFLIDPMLSVRHAIRSMGDSPDRNPTVNLPTRSAPRLSMSILTSSCAIRVARPRAGPRSSWISPTPLRSLVWPRLQPLWPCTSKPSLMRPSPGPRCVPPPRPPELTHLAYGSRTTAKSSCSSAHEARQSCSAPWCHRRLSPRLAAGAF